MKVVERLMNRSEEVVYRELTSIAVDNGLKVFSKTRLSDVLQTAGTRLPTRVFDYFTRSHCDFVVTDHEYHPVMAIEYDGPSHADPKQQELDKMKNDLCGEAGLGLLRVRDQHVTRSYGGMSILRWIIEVTELEKIFYDAQEKGHIPLEEPFDPLSLNINGEGCKFWLSRKDTIKLNKFAEFKPDQPRRGWNTFRGRGENDSIHHLSCLFFEGQVLYVHTSVRRQGLIFPHYDLSSELDICEMGLHLDKFIKGEVPSLTPEQFRPWFERFCEDFSAEPASSRGPFPFNLSRDRNSPIKIL